MTSDHLPQMYPCLPANFLAATLLHFGMGNDDLRASVARRLLTLAGYIGPAYVVDDTAGAGRRRIGAEERVKPAEPA